ncbi:MAG: hypothetical protein AAF657_33360 [Acidobacteriota bacterium]
MFAIDTQRLVCRTTAIFCSLTLVLAAWTPALADEGPSEKIVPQPTFFLDDTDGGDDPFKGGCHWHYRDKVCSANKMFFSGDTCDGNILYEWTNQHCHEVEDDKKRYDCAEECKKRGSTGTCVELPNHCGTNMPSAACECRE